MIPSDAPKAGEVWRHYKGGEYKIVGVALHSDETWVVAYEPLYEAPYKLFTRPLAEWRDAVQWEGGEVARFIKVV